MMNLLLNMDFKNLEMNEFMFPPAKAGGNSKAGQFKAGSNS